MKDSILQDIIDYAKTRLMERSSYCGIADSDSMAQLNSDDGEGNDIIIEISVKPE